MSVPNVYIETGIRCKKHGYVSHGNIHEINTWRYMYHTLIQCGYAIYITFMLNIAQAQLTWASDQRRWQRKGGGGRNMEARPLC